MFSLDTVEATRTTGMNVTCLLPATATQPGWYRVPPLTDEQTLTRGSWFVRESDAERNPGSLHEIPHSQSFTMPKFVLAGLGVDDGWRASRHPRYVADLTGDGKGDLVGFGDDGVWTALGDGRGGFAPPRFALAALAPNAGGWDADRHPRIVADLRGGGTRDLLGFGDDGVWVAYGDGAGGFAPPLFVSSAFGVSSGWAGHARHVVDLTGDGRADILGFGDAGVWIALNDGSGGFLPPTFVLGALGETQTPGIRWTFVADLTGDGRPDVVGFDPGGNVTAALNDGAGGLGPAVVSTLGDEDRVAAASTWLIGDVTGDGRADLVSIEPVGANVARSLGDGTFAPLTPLVRWPDNDSESPWVESGPFLLADLTAGGAQDLVAFAEEGIWVALLHTTGPVASQFVAPGLGWDTGWRPELHTRLAADLTGDGRADLVAFGDAGVWVCLNQGEGPRPRPVLTD